MAADSLVDDILSRARILLVQGQVEEAAACVSHIASTQDLSGVPCDRLQLLGEITLELGQVDQARSIFLEAVKRSQDSEQDSYSKYLWLAQISEDGGKEAAGWFERGIAVLTKRLEAQGDDSDLKFKLASALCGLAELYLTELCMQDDAEQKCQEYVTRAIELDPYSSDAYQTLASIRISQQRMEEAKQAIQKSLSMISEIRADNPPTYSSRISLSRVLIEVGEYTSALEMLSNLQKEDDEIVDLWYLYGWCFFISVKECVDEEERKATLQDARECLEICESVYKRLEWDDEGIREHVVELLAIINGEIPEKEDESECGWEDLESDEDGMNIN
ncbi:putative assembly chaperone of rpl4 [Neolecta irregularis DAH-3]|uniref:Putative assembly chaperone of rpl4 n=1 Tax=Neolecta irregularis (strain DAH-3) TaxID=1198029 RepID=A0A1U7LPR6_NEOID|nr:putative assembly chaperone of rpl4 [Neolecta irregularis DAH-3]|eukprot:OLL24647.1 putative assembly chaperone of rpl4 [Neolecta irregularis DAH-3]